MRTNTHLRCLPVLAACAFSAWPGVAHAAAPDGRLFQPDRAWLERYDSTLVASRFLSEFSYESYDNDSDVFGTHNQYAWSIGGELPLSSESFEFKLATGFTWSF